jgi:hypothetical protein
MRRALVGLVLVVAAVTFGAIVRGQGAQGSDPGFLKRNFSPVAYLKASNPRADAKLGFGSALTGRTLAMSRDGNTIAVSAPDESSAAKGVNGNQKDDTVGGSGAVYVFTRGSVGRPWAQEAYLKASNTDGYDSFGFSLALSGNGNTLAVTATREDSNARGINGNQADNSAANAGATYVFTRSGATWSQQTYLKGEQTDAGDLFGFCVDLSSDGNSLAICGFDEDGGVPGVNGNQADNSKAGSGCVYIFVRDGASWKQTTYLKQSNLNHNQDAFGSAIALSGDGRTLVVDAADEDGTGGGINGPQYDGEQIGDHSNGALFVFVNTNGTWSQQAYIKSSNVRINDLFGIRLAISRDGNVFAASSMLQGGGGRGVTANQQDFSGEESGAVYVFTRAGTTWTQRAYLKSPNSDAYDEFGSGVAMSGDGNTLAIAAFGEDGGSAGVGGNEADNSVRASGAVYVY